MDQNLRQRRDNPEGLNHNAEPRIQYDIPNDLKRRLLEISAPQASQEQQEAKEREQRENRASHSSPQNFEKLKKGLPYIIIIVLAIVIGDLLRSPTNKQLEELQTQIKELEKFVAGQVTNLTQATDQKLQTQGKQLEEFIAGNVTNLTEVIDQKLQAQGKQLEEFVAGKVTNLKEVTQAQGKQLEEFIAGNVTNLTQATDQKLQTQGKQLEKFVAGQVTSLKEAADQKLQAQGKQLEEFVAGNVTNLKEVTHRNLQTQGKQLEKFIAGNVTNLTQATNQKLQAETASFRKNDMNSEQQLKELQRFTESELMRISHRESGHMSQQWRVAPNPLGNGGGCMRKTVKFEKSFSKEPTFVIGFTMIDSERSKNLRIRAHAEKISVDGFEFVCCTWADSIIHGFTATWTAFEN